MVQELTDHNYSKLVEQTDKPIFVDFYSPNCGPCQTLLSFIDKIADYAEKKEVLVYECNVTINPKIAKKYEIQSVPFTCGITKDKKIVYPELGLHDYGYYIGIIDKLSGNSYSFFKRIFGKLKS